MKKIVWYVLIGILVVGIIGCGSKETEGTKQLQVVATTTMLTDLAKRIGGDMVGITGLMGPGVDPHLYKASAGDVAILQKADMVIYNGLHLEGKMGEVFEHLSDQDKLVVELAEGLSEEELLTFEANTSLHDPHIWFDVKLWQEGAQVVLDGFIALDLDNEQTYRKNFDAYMEELRELDIYVTKRAQEIPKARRILVTAHDAFKYFGKAYGFRVKGLQGISTASEAGTSDVRHLANFIVEEKIKAVFVESSVPKKNIEALQEAVKAQGYEVAIGGELYSDSLGTAGTEAGTYIGTIKANIDTIVDALK